MGRIINARDAYVYPRLKEIEFVVSRRQRVEDGDEFAVYRVARNWDDRRGRNTTMVRSRLPLQYDPFHFLHEVIPLRNGWNPVLARGQVVDFDGILERKSVARPDRSYSASELRPPRHDGGDEIGAIRAVVETPWAIQDFVRQVNTTTFETRR